MTFKRKRYVPAPSAPPKKLTRAPNYASASVAVPVPKVPLFRSEAYKRYVAEQECLSCKLVGFSQAAHENMGKGMALKQCDSRLFPLCTVHFGVMGCHEEYDLGLDGLARWERRLWAEAMVRRMQERAMEAGWRFTPEGIVAP
jgi:hypothetical protein